MSSGEDEVQRREQRNILGYKTLGLGCKLAQSIQDLVDFLLLLCRKLAKIIVQLDNRHRLDEQSRAGG